MSPEELARRKEELIRVSVRELGDELLLTARSAQEYGLIEEEAEKELAARLEAERTPDAVLPDPRMRSKKARKKAERGVDVLMQPNLNAAAVKGAELARRQEDAEKARAKREKDKYDLKKQKDDAERKKQDRQKKAAKQERRA